MMARASAWAMFSDHRSLIDAFRQVPIECEVLQHLLLDRLREFFQHALGDDAFEHSAHHAFGCGWVGLHAHQEVIHVSEAKRLGHLAAQDAECCGSGATQCRETGLCTSHQAVCSLLADLTGCAAVSGGSAGAYC